MNNALDITCAISTFFTTLGVNAQLPEGTNPWMQLLVAFASALIFSLVSIGGRILTGWLEKKGIISKEDKKKIDENLEDLADDGKVNGSNKEN